MSSTLQSFSKFQRTAPVSSSPNALSQKSTSYFATFIFPTLMKFLTLSALILPAAIAHGDDPAACTKMSEIYGKRRSNEVVSNAETATPKRQRKTTSFKEVKVVTIRPDWLTVQRCGMQQPSLFLYIPYTSKMLQLHETFKLMSGIPRKGQMF